MSPRRCLLNPRQAVTDEFLSTKAGFDGHHQQQIHLVETWLDGGFSASKWHHWLRMAMKRPTQVAGHQIDRHRREHQNHAEPDAPITMRTFPIGTVAMMKFIAIGIFKPAVFFFDWVVHTFPTLRSPPSSSFM
jgi:hypothetical protein